MIKPIQQSVAFKGVEKANGADNFTGNKPAIQSVRGDYSNAIDNVLSVQQSMREKVNGACAGKLDVIA